MKMKLATPGSIADTTGKPAAATHVLMYWPPSGGAMELLRKRIAGSGEWVIYTLLEYLTGDYCQGDRWLLNASRRRLPDGLAAWAGRQLGFPVTLQYAGETRFGPVYWATLGDKR